VYVNVSYEPGFFIDNVVRAAFSCKHVRTWRNYNFWAPDKHSLRALVVVLIHNSGHFGSPLPFWAPGPPALPGLPMAGYTTDVRLSCVFYNKLTYLVMYLLLKFGCCVRDYDSGYEGDELVTE